MKNKIFDLIVGLLFVAALTLGVVAHGADTGTVTATVTVQNVSVSVSDGTVAYGTLIAGVVTNTLSGGLNDQQSATNNGNVTENLNIKGQNSASWTLASTSSTDQYAHKFSTSSSFVGTAGVLLTTSYATLTTTVATNATRTFHLEIHTPTVSTVYTSQSVDVTVQAVAQ